MKQTLLALTLLFVATPYATAIKRKYRTKGYLSKVLKHYKTAPVNVALEHSGEYEVEILDALIKNTQNKKHGYDSSD